MTTRLFVLAAMFASLAFGVTGCGGGGRNEDETLPAVPLHVNLVENSSFEEWNGLLPNGWGLVHVEGDGRKLNQYGPSPEEKMSGSFSLCLRGAYNTDKWMAVTQRQAVLPGHQLRFGAHMKSQALTKNQGQTARANMYIRFYDKNGKRVSDRRWADNQTHFLMGTVDWTRRGRRMEVPAKARTVEVGLVCQLTGAIYFDDVELVLEEPIPWRVVETQYVDFYALDGHPFPDGAIERQTRYVKNAVKMLALDPQPEHKISYYYYPSDEIFRKIRGGELGPTHSRLRASAHELHTTRTYDDHEIVHLLLEPLGYPPFGLAEGAVFHVIGSWEGGRNIHMMAKEALLAKRLPALFHIVDQRRMMDLGEMISVPGWASFSMWLIDRRGIDAFMKLYVETNGVEDVGAFKIVFQKVYGREFEEMDREWRLWVLRYKPEI